MRSIYVPRPRLRPKHGLCAGLLLLLVILGLAWPEPATATQRNLWAPIADIAARNVSLVPWRIVRAGIDTIPVSLSRKLALMRFVRDAFGKYHAFTEREMLPVDIPSLNGTALRRRGINFFTMINKVFQKRHTSERLLLKDLGRVVAQFHDSHAKLFYSCFAFYAQQPFSVATVPFKGRQRFIIDGVAGTIWDNFELRGEAFAGAVFYPKQSDPAALARVQSANSLDPFLGAEILGIDSRRAIDYFFAYADGVDNDLAKDSRIAFNDLFTRYVPAFGSEGQIAYSGAWANRPYTHAPERDAVTYKLKLASGGIVVVSIPWLVPGMIRRGKPIWQSPQDYYNECMGQTRLGRRIDTEVGRMAVADPTGNTATVAEAAELAAKDPSYFYDVRPGLPGWQVSSPVPPPALHKPTGKREPLTPKWTVDLMVHHDASLLAAVLVRDSPGINRVAVITFPLGMGHGTNTQFASIFVPTLRKLQENFAQANQPFRLVIDLSDNRGGAPCFGLALLHFFFPRSKENPPKLDARISPWMLSNAQKICTHTDARMFSVWDYRSFGSLEMAGNCSANAVRARSNFLVTTVRMPINGTGRTVSVSEKTTYGCFLDMRTTAIDEEWFSQRPVPNTEPFLAPKFDPAQLLIVSNGICGSACGTTLRWFREQGVRVLVHGGPLGKGAPVPDCFLGGYVASLRELKREAEANGIKGGPVFPAGGLDVNLVPVEIYGDRGPMEFEYRAAELELQVEPESMRLEDIADSMSLVTIWGKSAEKAWP